MLVKRYRSSALVFAFGPRYICNHSETGSMVFVSDGVLIGSQGLILLEGEIKTFQSPNMIVLLLRTFWYAYIDDTRGID